MPDPAPVLGEVPPPAKIRPYPDSPDPRPGKAHQRAYEVVRNTVDPPVHGEELYTHGGFSIVFECGDSEDERWTQEGVFRIRKLDDAANRYSAQVYGEAISLAQALLQLGAIGERADARIKGVRQ
jgi:hypothetical protein